MMQRYDTEKECYFRFRASPSVKLKELKHFLREVVEPKALDHFPVTGFHRVRRGDPYRQFGEAFTIQDERLKGAPLYDPVRIYLHNSDRGEVVLRPLSGLVLTILSEKKVITSLGFLKFAKVLRDRHRRILAEFPYGDDWVFQGKISPPDPHIVELVELFSECDYLDDLFDEESERDYEAFEQECQDLP